MENFRTSQIERQDLRGDIILTFVNILRHKVKEFWSQKSLISSLRKRNFLGEPSVTSEQP